MMVKLEERFESDQLSGGRSGLAFWGASWGGLDGDWRR